MLATGAFWLTLLLIPLAAAWSRSPDLAHGWAAPLLMVYLWWERLPSGASSPGDLGRGGLALGVVVVFTIVLSLVGLRLFLEPFPLWPVVLILYALGLLTLGGLFVYRHGGRAWAMWLLAPCIVLVGAVPWPGLVDQLLIQPLREGLASVAAEFITLFAQPALAQGTSVRLASGWVGIDEACGGIRSLQASVMLALFFGELGRFGLNRRIALFFAGVAAALFGNFARILFLAFTATGGAEEVHAAHDTAGWLALGLTLVGVGAVAWVLRPGQSGAIEQTVVSPPLTPDRPSTARRAVLPFALIPLAALALSELGVRFWFDSGEARQAEIRGWEARLPDKRPDFRDEPLGELAREMLQPDAYQAGRWLDDSGERTAAYTIEWHHGQIARTLPFLHNPTVCLPLAGCELRKELGMRVFQFGDLALPFHSYLFSRAGEEFLVSFLVWDPSRGEPLRQPQDHPGWFPWIKTCWNEVLERRRHQPAQMLCVALYGTDAERRTQDVLNLIIQPPERGR